MNDLKALAQQIKVAAERWLDPAVQKGLEAQDRPAPMPKLPLKPAPVAKPIVPTTKKAAAVLQQVARDVAANKPAPTPFYSANPEGIHPANRQRLETAVHTANPQAIQKQFGQGINAASSAVNAVGSLAPAAPQLKAEADQASLQDNLGLGRQAANRAIFRLGQDKLRPIPPLPAPAPSPVGPVPAAPVKKAQDMNPARGGGGKETSKILTPIRKDIALPLDRASAGEKNEKVATLLTLLSRI